jgi:superfamily II DNA helicase RecQ
MALRATVKPPVLRDILTNVLRDGVVIKGNVDRPNVEIHIAAFKLEADSDFIPLAKLIVHTAKGEKSTVYCSYTAECEKLELALVELGVESRSYTHTYTAKRHLMVIYFPFTRI